MKITSRKRKKMIAVYKKSFKMGYKNGSKAGREHIAKLLKMRCAVCQKEFRLGCETPMYILVKKNPHRRPYRAPIQGVNDSDTGRIRKNEFRIRMV